MARWCRRLLEASGRVARILSGRGRRPRRARGKGRRYCAANRLNRFGTLTYAGEGCHDPLELLGHVAGFFRQLRGGLGCVPLPYAWAAEWHPGGHGLHVHFAVGRYVPHNLIRDVWGRGRIHIKLIGDLPVGSGALEEARKAGIQIYQGLDRYLNCRGLGLCGTCLVLVKKGMENLSEKSLREKINFNVHPKTMLAIIGHEEEARLACQVFRNGARERAGKDDRDAPGA